DLLLDTDWSPQQLDWTTCIKSSDKNLMSILDEIHDQSKLEAGKLASWQAGNFSIGFSLNLFSPR
ncbi:MAG: hypothetical protein ACI8W1_003218, partial [Candidatus Azotimanducaceae bacterium]